MTGNEPMQTQIKPKIQMTTATPIVEKPIADETPIPTMVRIANFSAWYSDFQALHGLSLDIPEKRVTSFIGPSGCGISSLL